MQDAPSENPTHHTNNKTHWLHKLTGFLRDRASNSEELLKPIRQAEEDKILDKEALETIEGAMNISKMQVRDIMIPRSQMAVVKTEQPPTEFMQIIMDTSHSRFPVVGESVDEVVGILLAKELLPLIFNHKLNSADIVSVMRAPVFVPESKRLSILLNEFRTNRHHMAIVLDEYGGVAGLVTIEDVLEQIVGEIEDETDAEEGAGNIRNLHDSGHVVKAITPIDDFNKYFGTDFSDIEFDTIGGILTQQFGHLPVKDETINVNGFTFKIVASDNRRIKLIHVNTVIPTASSSHADT